MPPEPAPPSLPGYPEENGGGGGQWSPAPGDYTPPVCEAGQLCWGGSDVPLDPTGIYPTTPQEVLLLYFPTMTTAQYSMLNTNPQIASNLSAYLYEHNFSDDAQKLVDWAIKDVSAGIVSWLEFQNFFIIGYRANFLANVVKLTASEKQTYIK